MNKSQISRRLVTAIFASICIMGFLYQVTGLIATYLQYRTVTKITADIQRYTFAPDIHLCPITSTVFDFEKFNKGKPKSEQLSANSEAEHMRFESLTSIKDLFEYSPSTDSFMRACVIRRPNSNEFTEYEGNSCSELFKISKYYILEYICYHIQLIPYDDDQGYETNDIALAQNFPGVYYTMTLNDHWLSGLNLFKIMSIERREGTKSMASAPVMSRGLRNGSALNTYFYVSHTKMVYQRLPPPFDTMCVDYRAQGMSSSASCLNNCMLKWTLQHLDRYWYGSRSNDPVDKRPLSPADFQSATFNATFQGISDRCKKACYQLECDLTWTLTSVQSDRIYNSITFQIVVPKQPSFIFICEARLTTESFILFFMSCIGSWFGLSVLSFDPVRILARIRRHLERHHPDSASPFTRRSLGQASAQSRDSSYKVMARMLRKLDKLEKELKVQKMAIVSQSQKINQLIAF